MSEIKRNGHGAMDMTQGSPTRLIVLFSLPLLAGNVLQQLYNMVDSVVVGNYVGSSALTAVGQIQAGAVLGYIGAIEYLIRHAKEEIGQPDTKVVATGGLSRLVADNTELIDVVDPQLVLDGLRIIYERARR